MRHLDLFCGAGGASEGYNRAGFKVYGVDIKKYKRYPFPFHQGDALEVLATLLSGGAVDFEHPDGTIEWLTLDDFVALHGSPPCQAYSHSTKFHRNAGHEYPDLLAPTREAFEATGKPWVIENVPGTPMRADYRLCGCFFGLELRRVRLFETSWRGFAMTPTHDHTGFAFSVIGDTSTSSERKKLGRNATQEERNRAMGIDWMKGHELGLAIPPQYTEFIGGQLLFEIANRHFASDKGAP